MTEFSMKEAQQQAIAIIAEANIGGRLKGLRELYVSTPNNLKHAMNDFMNHEGIRVHGQREWTLLLLGSIKEQRDAGFYEDRDPVLRTDYNVQDFIDYACLNAGKRILVPKDLPEKVKP